jgi:hypothetical protein
MQQSQLYHKRRYAESTDSLDRQKEHAATGLRRLRPEEACSGQERCRNGRKRSGADRCARSGPRGSLRVRPGPSQLVRRR